MSKKIGKAFLRNRIKRLVREYFRLNQHQIPARYDFVLIPKKHVPWDRLSLNEVSQDLDNFFQTKGSILG